MDFNPVDVQRHLKGADYPATGEELASTAQSNDAPGDLVDKLRSLGGEEFSGPDKVMGRPQTFVKACEESGCGRPSLLRRALSCGKALGAPLTERWPATF